MSLPLAYHPDVQDEIDAAYAWYEQRRSGLGEEFIFTLTKQLVRIQANPESYAVLHRQVRGSPMRRFPYVVYYRIEADRIMVVAVQHGGRRPRAWRART